LYRPVVDLLWTIPAALALLLIGSPAHATPVSFGFTDQPQGATTPLSESAGGLTASFSSSGDPLAFGIVESFFATLPGNVLVDDGVGADANLTLTVTFSRQITAISLLFALDDTGTDGTLSLATNAGGSATAGAAPPSGYQFAEGALSFSGAAFSTITLTSTAPGFAVDAFTVIPVPVGGVTNGATPIQEPPSLVLLGVGLVGLAGLRRRA